MARYSKKLVLMGVLALNVVQVFAGIDEYFSWIKFPSAVQEDYPINSEIIAELARNEGMHRFRCQIDPGVTNLLAEGTYSDNLSLNQQTIEGKIINPCILYISL